jgi:hypothetical protein
MRTHTSATVLTVAFIIAAAMAVAVAISLAITTPAYAKENMVCGRYVSGAHQAAIEHVSTKESKDGLQHTDSTDLDNLDAFIRRKPEIGSCVCAYGKVRNDTFIKLRKIEKISNKLCEVEGL